MKLLRLLYRYPRGRLETIACETDKGMEFISLSFEKGRHVISITNLKLGS